MGIKGDNEGVPSIDSSGNTRMMETVGNKSDTVAGNSGISLLKQVLAAVAVVDGVADAIKAKTDVLEGTNIKIVSRTARAIAASESLFTITGRVVLLDIVGEVVTNLQAQATETKIVANPTVGGDADLCTVLDLTGFVAGSIVNITGAMADALIGIDGGGTLNSMKYPVILSAGTLDLISTAGGNTGTMKWTALYRILDSGSSMAADYPA